ncbi:MAG: rhomboid family intramembrane serine protease [Fusicatenibacter sp.]|nr:rhomboid family intramembrane serine protease [Fusicatenibacter sp.]
MNTPRYEYDPDEDFVERLRRNRRLSMNLLIVILNLIVFLLVTVTGGSGNYENMMRWGAAYAPAIRSGEYYRLLTSMFLHFGINHLISNMVLLLFLGDYLERYAGKAVYLLIYLGGGLCGNLCSYLHELEEMAGGVPPVISAGASGAIFAVVGAMIVLLIFHRGHIEDLGIRRMGLMAFCSLIVGFQSSNVDNQAHLGGFFAGIVGMVILYPLVLFRGKRRRKRRFGRNS